jgi:hypothetical protein
MSGIRSASILIVRCIKRITIWNNLHQHFVVKKRYYHVMLVTIFEARKQERQCHVKPTFEGKVYINI